LSDYTPSPQTSHKPNTYNAPITYARKYSPFVTAAPHARSLISRVSGFVARRTFYRRESV